MIRDCYIQFQASTLENLEETEGFLETHNLPRLNHKEIKDLNRPMMSKEIESVIKKFPGQKTLRTDGFTGKFN